LPLAGQAAGLKSSLGFQGTTINADAALNSGVLRIPPDTMGAIGLSQFLETSNGSISVYDRSNGSLVNRQNLGSFWSAVSPNLTGSGGDQRGVQLHFHRRLFEHEPGDALPPWGNAAFDRKTALTRGLREKVSTLELHLIGRALSSSPSNHL
jgi:hypothetical protein